MDSTRSMGSMNSMVSMESKDSMESLPFMGSMDPLASIEMSWLPLNSRLSRMLWNPWIPWIQWNQWNPWVPWIHGIWIALRFLEFKESMESMDSMDSLEPMVSMVSMTSMRHRIQGFHTCSHRSHRLTTHILLFRQMARFVAVAKDNMILGTLIHFVWKRIISLATSPFEKPKGAWCALLLPNNEHLGILSWA